MQGIILISIVCINGFIALSEMALVSSKKVRLQRLVDQGRRGADVALFLSESPTKFLASMQICLTILGIMAGVHGGATMANEIEKWVLATAPTLAPWGHAIGMSTVVAFETFLMVFLGELLPKRLALIAPESIAVRVAPAMMWIGNTLSPAAHILSKMTDTVLERFPLKNTPEDLQSVTEDEFKMIVEQGAEEGVFDRNEETMIKRVLQFGDIKAADIMTPRTKLIGINIEDSIQNNIDVMLASHHAFFPVYRQSIDNLIGILSIKKMFEYQFRHSTLKLEPCMSEPLFLPDSARVDRVLESMKSHGTHMAVLIDEFGGLAGVITATDIVESIMGEVPQDRKESLKKFVERSDGSMLVDGMVTLLDLQEKLEIDCSEIGDGVQTVSGLIMHVGREIPKEGQVITFQDWSFEVVDMDGNRIDKVLASRAKKKIGIPPSRPKDGTIDENTHC